MKKVMEKTNIQKTESNTFLLCQFCEVSSEMRYRCLNCELVLCCSCDERIHSKIKSDVVHKRTVIEESGKENEMEGVLKVNLLNMKCNIHKSKACVIYCKDCEKPLCPSCIIDCHQQHKLVELDEEFQRQRNRLGDLKTEIQNRLSNIERREEIVGKNQFKAKENHENVKSGILKNENIITKRINDCTDGINIKLTNQWKFREDNLRQNLSIAHQNKKDLEGFQKMLSNLAYSDQAKDIIEKCFLIKSNLPSKEFFLRQTKSQPIIFCDFDAGSIGSLEIPIGIVHDRISFDIIGTYKSNMDCITHIYCLSDSELLLYNSQTQILQVLTCSGGDLVQMFNKNIFASDIAVSNAGRIYILSNVSCKHLNYKSEKIIDLKSPSEAKLFCIHVNRHNQIITGAIPYSIAEFDADFNESGDDSGSSDRDRDDYDNNDYYDDHDNNDYYDDHDNNDYYGDYDNNDYYGDYDNNAYYGDYDNNDYFGDYDNCDDYGEYENECDHDHDKMPCYSGYHDNGHGLHNEKDKDHDSRNTKGNDHGHNENDNDHNSHKTKDINCEQPQRDDNNVSKHDSHDNSADEVYFECLNDTNNYSEDELYGDQYDSYNDSRDCQKDKTCVGEIYILNHHGFERLETSFVPHRIATTSKDNFCIIEQNHGEGRVLCYNTTEGITWTYSGCQCYAHIHFYPQQLAVSQFDFVFVLDNIRAIHVLNQNGELLKSH